MRWLGVFVGTLFGFVGGFIVSSASNFGTNWFKPEVLGGIAGAFLAAMIGLAGAAWVHFAGVRERKAEKARDTRQVSAKLFAVSLQLHAYLHVLADEISEAIKTGMAHPYLICAYQIQIRNMASRFSSIAEHEALNVGIFTHAGVIANGLNELCNGWSSPELDEDNDDLFKAVPSPEANSKAARIHAFSIKLARDQVLEFMKNLESADPAIRGISAEIERDIDQQAQDFIDEIRRKIEGGTEATSPTPTD